jgi:hypothetical protein
MHEGKERRPERLNRDESPPRPENAFDLGQRTFDIGRKVFKVMKPALDNKQVPRIIFEG